MSSLSGTHHDEAEAAAEPSAANTDRAGPPSTAVPAGPRQPRPDVEMIRQAQAGDRGAYGQLVVLYQDRLYNAIVRLVGDREEALELTQETFTRGLIKLDSFRGDASPYTWLFRIAVNLSISQLRKVQRNRVFSLDRPGSGFGSRSGGNGKMSHGGGRMDDDSQGSSLLDRVSRDGRGTGSSELSDAPAQRVERRERDQMVLAALGRLDAEYR